MHNLQGRHRGLFHAFRDCYLAWGVWSRVSRGSLDNAFFGQDRRQWLMINIGGSLRAQPHWSVLSGVVIDCTWRARKDWVFNQR